MNILFIHRGFPAQYEYLTKLISRNPANVVLFLTADESSKHLNGVHKIVYKPRIDASKRHNQRLCLFEEDMAHGQAAAEVAMCIKAKGIIPDVIIGHSWGPTTFMKEVFPDVPILCYFEWFTQPEGASIDFEGNQPGKLYREKIRCDNASSLLDLYSCDAGITPTNWQKNQFPKEFHDKIKVLHDGINTDACVPNKYAKFVIKEKNIELTADDEVITYATRGMEPIRGFPQFIEAVAKLQIKRPNAHFVIAGTNEVFYGSKSDDGTYKDLMLEKYKLNMDKVHFVNFLPYNEYINLLQISSVHIYLTYPFILSWSVLEAMSAGCCVIASNTKPVLEIIKDNYDGLLVDFFDVDQLVEKIEYALNNQDKMQEIRTNARKTVVDNYALNDLLPKHVEYIESVIRNAKAKK